MPDHRETAHTAAVTFPHFSAEKDLHEKTEA
jgi:hypothetical protein